MTGPGTRLGVYEVISLLGSGGMGEVYRARDTKLGRDVAIKTLPASFAADPERLARFEREARLLASLNHPHIAAIYGIEERDGVTALVLELVEGETLAERLARAGIRDSGIGIRDSLAIARQVADALDAAHERGIVHRDLKPANIVITPEGVVKVLDFGLAKAGGPGGAGGSGGGELTNSPTMIAPTMDGVLLGTAPYMSPEQARGKAVDKRTDIWAFGCVLYEMLTGRRAFVGETTSDTIVAILEREPDWTALPPPTPAHVVHLLRRCFEKDAKRRLRDIADARAELEADVAQPVDPAAHPAIRRSHRLWPAVAMAAVIASVVAALWQSRTTRTEGPTIGRASVERVTFDAGLADTPSLSVDGRLLSYASDRAGRGDLDIWVQQLPAGAPLRVTNDSADDVMPDFSPDGTQIVFRSERGGGGLYVVSTLGGGERLIGPDGRMPRFSPDGKRIAYWTGAWRGAPGALSSAVFVLPLTGGAPTRLLSDFAMARDPVWAADGQSLLVLGRRDRTSPLTQSFDCWWVPLDGRPPARTGLLDLVDFRTRIVTDPITFGGWTPSGVLIAMGGSLWSVPISSTTGRVSGEPRQLLLGAGSYTNPAISRDGHIVFAALDSPRSMERASIDRIPDSSPPVVIYSDHQSGASRPSQTADGSRMVFGRVVSGYHEIWMKGLPSGEERMVLRVETKGSITPTVSPNGARIVYTISSTGPSDDRGAGFVVDARGGVPKSICSDCGVHGFLSDNRRVLIVADHQRRVQVLDVETLGTQDAAIGGEGEIDRPHASPDDRWLSLRYNKTDSGDKVYITHLVPGRPTSPSAWLQIDEPTTTGRPCGWSLDSRVAYCLLDIDGFRCLWGQRVDTVHTRLQDKPFAVRHFHSTMLQEFSTTFGNAIGPGGFLYGAGRLSGNLWRVVPMSGRPDTSK